MVQSCRIMRPSVGLWRRLAVPSSRGISHSCRGNIAASLQNPSYNRGDHSSRNYFPLSPSGHQHIAGLHSSAARHGVVRFKLADIGEGIAEAELLAFYKKAGENVEEMEPICQVQSDKAAVEISSRYTGKILKFYNEIGEMVKIGGYLCDIEVEGEGEDEPEPAPEEKAAPTRPAESPARGANQDSGGSRVEAPPMVRRLANELGVDLGQVKGTGPRGRITKTDVERTAAEGPGGGSGSPAKPAAAAASTVPAPIRGGGDKKVHEVQMSAIGRAMVQSMTESAKIPHLNIGEEVDVTRLREVQQQLKAHVLATENVKLSLTPFLIKAMSQAISAVPIINSKFVSDKTFKWDESHNISVAIDTPYGLVVPNIKSCEERSIMDIQAELGRLVELANNNRLSLDDLRGGTISLSNIGVIGGTYVHALLFDGQGAIIATGRTVKRPTYIDNQLVPRDIMNVGISADHRHLDGATVARFTAELRKYLEHPELLLLKLR